MHYFIFTVTRLCLSVVTIIVTYYIGLYILISLASLSKEIVLVNLMLLYRLMAFGKFCGVEMSVETNGMRILSSHPQYRL